MLNTNILPLLFITDGPSSKRASDRFSTLAKCNSLDAVTEEPEDFTIQIAENGDSTQNNKGSPSATETANGRPHFFKNTKAKTSKSSKYGIVGVLGGGMVNGGVKSKPDKPPKPLRSYSRIAQIFEEFSVSKIKVGMLLSGRC